MKKIRIIVILMIWCILAALPARKYACAEVKEQTLFDLKKVQNITVTVTYKYDDVYLELISPSGQIITKDTDTEMVTVLSGKTATIFLIGQAETGVWKMRYDKGSNESISVSSDVQDTSFFITDYTVGSLQDNHIPAEFTVTSEESIRYSYKISLTTDTESLTGKELVNGRGYTGETVSVTVPLDNASSYDNYHLLLYVSYDLNGTEVFDYKFSEAFSYTNAAAPEVLENVDIVIDHDLQVVELNWRNYLPSRAQSVYITVHRGAEEILSGEYLCSDGYEAEIPFAEGDSFSIGLCYRNNYGLISELLKKEVNTKDEMLLLPESGLTSSNQWMITYQGANQTLLEVLINDDRQSLMLHGSGNEYITLQEERNKIILTYQDAQGYTHKYQRAANVSLVTPEIDLLRQIDGVTTEKKTIVISGTTNADILTLNGREIVVEDGAFHYIYELTVGGNPIVLEASIGEIATRVNAYVTRKEAPVPVVVYLAAGLAVSAVGILVMSLMIKFHNKKLAAGVKEKSGKGWIVLLVLNWLAAVIIWVGWGLLKHYTGSVKYLELAYKSISKAEKLLALMPVLLWTATGLSALAAVGTIVYIIVTMLCKKRKEKLDETIE